MLISSYSFAKNDIISVISSNSSELIIKYKIENYSFDPVTLSDGSIAYRPRIEGTVFSGKDKGSPDFCSIINSIVVPTESGFSISEIKIISQDRKEMMIAPVPQISVRNSNVDPIFTIDRIKYQNSKLPEFVQLNYAGLAGSNHIARLVINSAAYDYSTNSIIIPTEILIKIKFKIPFGTKTNANIQPSMLDNAVLNTSQISNWAVNLQPDKRNTGTPKTQNNLQSTDKNCVKMAVANEGIYKVTSDQLASLGVKISQSDIAKIKVYGRYGNNLSESVIEGNKSILNEQDIIVKTKPNGDLDEIIFYGAPAYGFIMSKDGPRHYLSDYSWKNYYILNWSGDIGKRAVAIDPPTEPVIARPNSYIANIFYQEQFYNAFTYPASGRFWFGRESFPAVIDTLLPNIDRSNKIKFKFSLAHRSNNSGNFSVNINTINIGNFPISGTSSDAFCIEQEAASLGTSITPDEHCTININYSNLNKSSIPYFNWYEIQYRRSFVPISDELEFFAEKANQGINEFTITPFKNSEIYGYDVSDPSNPKLLKNAASTGGMYILKSKIDSNVNSRFFIGAKFHQPTLAKIEFAGLRSITDGADLIVIAAPEFIESVKKYAAYRSQKSGIKVIVVTTEQIYNEFSYTIADPTAYRDFIAFAYRNWALKPRYVLLWGDGHYDYKNITTTATRNYVLPYETKSEVDSFDQIDSYTTDDYFGRIVGEDLIPDLAIGRITADSPEISDWMAEKIKNYETNSSRDIWRCRATLLADDSQAGNNGNGIDHDGAAHTNGSEYISLNCIPDFILQKKIYLVEYPTENVPGGRRKPRVNQEMISTINNEGTLLLSWFGHGNPRVWAHEEILERGNDIPQMVNSDKYYFCTAATCDYARFDYPDGLRSGAEEMLLSKRGGAIGLLSTTRSVYIQGNEAITASFYSNLFQQNSLSGDYSALGDVLFKVKLNNTSDNDQKYYLLGDPTMYLNYPKQNIVIDKINSIDLANYKDTLHLKAMQEISLEGRVLMNKSIDTSFNGNAVITMLDGDDFVVAIDVDGSEHNIDHFGGILNRSNCTVVNGNFKTKFIIPKDISFSHNLGRLYVYSNSNDNRYAKSSLRKFIIDSALILTGIGDIEGPEIKLYLDSREFQQGNVVRAVPLLIADITDKSGINTTGSGIGHNIEAWVDDEINSIDLTNSFETSSNIFGGGTAQGLLYKLTPGIHKVKVRAWDVFNNFSTASTYFQILPSDNGIYIYNLLNYPNPILNGSSTSIKFYHNVSPPVDLTLKIYSTDGNLVRSIDEKINSPFVGEIVFDGYDNGFNIISDGNYLYEVILTDIKGNRAVKGGIMTYLK